MRAGELRHWIDIEKRSIIEGGTGDPVVTWVPIARDVPARIAPVTTREFMAGLLLASQVVAKITIRWRGDIDSTMRIKHRPKGLTPRTVELYNIAGPLVDYDHRKYITFPVTLGVNEG